MEYILVFIVKGHDLVAIVTKYGYCRTVTDVLIVKEFNGIDIGTGKSFC